MVRSDLRYDKAYYMKDGQRRDFATTEMLDLRGMVCTIEGIMNHEYLLAEDKFDFWWTDEMFVDLTKEPDDFDIPDDIGCLL